MSRSGRSSASFHRRGNRWRPYLETLELRDLPSASVLTSFPGLSEPMGEANPPDTNVAAGTSYVVETTNSAILIYNKATGAIAPTQSQYSFFSPLGNVLMLEDSVVIYDELLGRFAIGALDSSSDNTLSRFDFAVSNTADPTGSWSFQRYDMNDWIGVSDYADFPRIGWNADAYVVTFNMYVPSDSNLFHVDALSISKNSINTAFRNVVPSLVTNGGQNSTLTPAVMHGAASGGPMWLMQEAGYANGNTLQVAQMTNVLSGSPIFTPYNIAVTPYGVAPSNGRFTVPQPGSHDGVGLIFANDTRILNVEFRSNLLVASQTVGASGNTEVHARFYEINVQGSPSLLQQVEVDRGPGVNTYYPSVAIDAHLDVGMTFMESSSGEYMSMYATGRGNSDQWNTLESPVLIQRGLAYYQTNEGNGNGPFRAGDFSGITVDPTTQSTFWAANEYATSGGSYNWGTSVCNFEMVSSIKSLLLSNGGIGLFAADSNGQAVTATYPPGGPWSSWSVLPGDSFNPGSPIAPLLLSNGGVDLFAADIYGQAVSISQSPGGSWGSWFAIPGDSFNPGAPVTPLLFSNGVINLFATDASGQVVTAWLIPGNPWSSWYPINGNDGIFIPGAPVTPLILTNGTIELFAPDVYNQAVTATYPPGGPWSSWFSLPGDTFTSGASIIPLYQSNGIINLFAADTNGQAVTAWLIPGSQWSSWYSIPGDNFIPGAPVTPLVENNGTIDLFAADLYGQCATVSYPPGGPWQSWSAIVGDIFYAGTPITPFLAWGNSVINLFASDQSGQAVTAWLIPGNPWSSWYAIPGDTFGANQAHHEHFGASDSSSDQNGLGRPLATNDFGLQGTGAEVGQPPLRDTGDTSSAALESGRDLTDFKTLLDWDWFFIQEGPSERVFGSLLNDVPVWAS